jgi:Flp pilus assembly pilin Flp
MQQLMMGWFIRVRERYKRPAGGQTMTEYSLILAAVAIVVFIAYETMGQSIDSMVTWNTIDLYLTGS